MTLRLAWRCGLVLLMSVVFAWGGDPATTTAPASRPAYTTATGPFPVRTLDLTWTDATRKRDVPVRIYAPEIKAAPGKLPTVVFSHGLGGSRFGYVYVGKFLASQGYICVMPTHQGSDTALLLKVGMLEMMKALNEDSNRIDRPLDVSFVIDRLLGDNADQPLINGRVDAKRIGAAGHSFGAYTALAVAGQTSDTATQKARSFRDERVRAALAMSPQVPGAIGLTRTSWDGIRIPALTMAGEFDIGVNILYGSMRRFAFEHMPAGNKYHIEIKGGNHMTFADSADGLTRDATPRDPRFHEWICQTLLAFFDGELRDLSAGRQWLQKDMESYSGGNCALFTRSTTSGSTSSQASRPAWPIARPILGGALPR